MTTGNVVGGHKATLSNPSELNKNYSVTKLTWTDASDEAKQRSEQVLNSEFNGGEYPKNEGPKNPNNVAGGLKA